MGGWVVGWVVGWVGRWVIEKAIGRVEDGWVEGDGMRSGSC